jgi:phosphoglycolate phosphatase
VLRTPGVLISTGVLVLLFDIDGTLVDTGGAGRRAMVRAFERVTGRGDACASVPFAGMTDRAIVRGGLEAVGRPADAASIDEVIRAYLEVLEDEVGRSTNCRVHAGIEAALERAHAAPRCAVGLGTGNVRDGARVKLSRVGIYERFSFGGFGCDHEDRGELLRIGAQRGADRLGAPLSACRVVVIGDTPRDIGAAKVIGAECVAVATGSFDRETLLAHGATRAYGDLGDEGALAALFG